MNYYERHRALIEAAELSVAPDQGDTDIASECADCIMDGCAEELAGIDPAILKPATRERMLRVLAAIRGVGVPT